MATPPPVPSILLEDGPLLAVNKPPGLLTQGVPEGLPTLERWVKEYLREKYHKPGNVYLGIPHRLDRPVSGVVVFARNSKAAARLAEQFRNRTVRKWYLAVTEGVPAEPSGTLVDWLLKDADAARSAVVPEGTPGARRCELRYELLATQSNRALVRVALLTGRMHQIRVQLAARGCPVWGDVQYGAAGDADIDEPHIALHAARLDVQHPVRYDWLSIRAPLPADWNRFGFAIESTDAPGA